VGLYQKVKTQLISDIKNGVVPPGGALPSETELAQRFNVSIGTIRRAVDDLVVNHILIRQQGRGTFVGKHDRDHFLYRFFKIEGRDGEREFPHVRMLSFAKARASVKEARMLDILPGAPVFCIDNLLSLQARPAIHDHIVIDAQVFAGLNAKRFSARSGTIYEMYQSDFGITVVDTHERVRAETADAASSQALALPAGTPVLRIERVALTFDQKPAEFRISVVDSRHFDYVSTLRGTL